MMKIVMHEILSLISPCSVIHAGGHEYDDNDAQLRLSCGRSGEIHQSRDYLSE